MMKIVLSGVVLLSAIIYSDAVQNCGSLLTATTIKQEFGTTNYPASYPSDQNCVWVIRPNIKDAQVAIQFTKIQTERCCDFVKVRDGDSPDSQLLLLPFSGDGNTTWNFVSTFNALYVEFKSDDSIEKKGFSANYKIARVSDPACGGRIVLDSKRNSLVSSPNYFSSPFTYPSFSYCTWIIEAAPRQQVNLTITSYQIEACCDSLMIRDGTESSSKIIGYLLGTSKKPKSYVSTGGRLLLRFRSDISVNGRGFSGNARSTLVRPKPARPARPPVITDCEQNNVPVPLTGHGNLTSPNYPNQHPGNLECYWVLRAPKGSKILLWFGLIDTEKCCDWIKIRDGPYYNSSKIDVISATPVNSLPYFVSNSNELRVEYDTDETLNKRGFRAYYEIYKPGHFEDLSPCGGNLDATKIPQYFSSPNFPGTYNDSSTCTWSITSPSATRIKLVFLSVHLEKRFDTLTVYEGSRLSTKSIFQFTGSYLTVYTVTSVNNQVTVVMKTDLSEGRAGFRATYQHERGSIFSLITKGLGKK